MTALRKVEQEGTAYELTWTITGSPLIVVAPHGGAIEPRTSEIAAAIAGAEHTQCQFKGKLPAGQNHPRLHVTSEKPPRTGRRQRAGRTSSTRYAACTHDRSAVLDRNEPAGVLCPTVPPCCVGCPAL
ncbi:poly-gamma-glutamate hydrolase family protein [Phytohabitans houttuyneae]|nr:poly-gamma-glutamate hydrolase family protein [Phytohabitans houttuyneae]